MRDLQLFTTRNLISELAELERIIARTPVFTHRADETVNISDDLRGLLVRKRQVIGELRLRRARSRDALKPVRRISRSQVNDVSEPVHHAPPGLAREGERGRPSGGNAASPQIAVVGDSGKCGRDVDGHEGALTA